jgi:hypothetical protein
MFGSGVLPSEFAALCEQPAHAMVPFGSAASCCPVQHTLLCQLELTQHGPFLETHVVFIERHGQRRLELVTDVGVNPGMKPPGAPIVVLNRLALVANDEGFLLRAQNRHLDVPAYCMDPGPGGVRFCSGAGNVAAAAGHYAWQDGFPVRVPGP